MAGLAPLMVMAALVGGCVTGPDPHTLTLVFEGDPASLDPAYATDVRMGQVNALLYDHLLRFDHGDALLPSLALSWTVSDDLRRYHFTLRRGVTFQNGDTLTAADVLFSFERLLDPATKSRRTWLFDRVTGARAFMAGDADGVAGFELPGPYELVINLEQPFAPFLGFLAMPAAAVVNRRQLADPNFRIGETGAGSGPWILDSWVHDGNISFVRNEHYFRGPPKFEALKIRLLPEVLPRSAEFSTGYIDIFDVPVIELPFWREDPLWGPRILEVPELNIVYLALNCSRPPFDDRRVRQAVNLAVNRALILEKSLYGQGVLANGPVPPGLAGYDPTLAPYPYDPEAAIRLLQEAGYEDGFSVELWQGQSVGLAKMTEAVQAQLGRIGVRVKLVQNDWNLFTEAIVQGKPDMYYRSWWADYPDAENFLAPLFHSRESMRRWNRYHNPQLDDLIDSIQREGDAGRREALVRQAVTIIHDDAPWIFLWHTTTPYLTQPTIEGWQPSLMFNAEKYVDVSRREGAGP
ncbi:MAG: hypothetical protein IIB42_03640 [Candidatus Marinimicrobia bacterium]|nr:hypothetical protein [Candidatus Neomarinimicrobiota bacterium]